MDRAPDYSKLCTRCKFHVPSPSMNPDTSTCTAESILSLVDGLSRTMVGAAYSTCAVKRTSQHDACGPDGRLWQAKTSA